MRDAIIVGGGPGGSTAAWRLAQSGVRALVIDGARFPRVKLCAGWVTRPVWSELGLDPATYPLTVQPFARATLQLDGAACETAWDHTVSFGIVRREFDHFLLERARGAGAEVIDGVRVLRLEHRAGRFVVETPRGDFAAPLLIGAGGHHCPVARAFGEIPERESVVVTQESETRIGRAALAAIAPRPGVPELFPEADLRGYGWYFSKGDFLNVGIGALDGGRGLHRRTQAFVERLVESGRLPRQLELEPFRGHAYAIRTAPPRRVAGRGFYLVGDAAGLARDVSGEGIAPAVTSGNLAAAHALQRLAGRDEEELASEYRSAIDARFGAGAPGFAARLAGLLPRRWLLSFGTLICRNAWLRRRLVFEGAFGMG
ncbi:MAG TPA: NAD(P)/FAD-dependent oxidoreductase [Candidatus Binatia bacterium]|nr:NAD(P)/FAD-dependent oxidoreductase [Candidatus Binatia bacterium]